ncbi:MAG TPA: hypothetical protein VJL37_10500 [Flavobacterium sp.]|nr:hypothetical protein [Flavobacterium sp.]
MNKLKILLLLVISSLGITVANAQEKATITNSIAKQFDYILMKSESYQDLKIVKRKVIESLQQDVLGSISKIESELYSSKSVMSQQQNQISSLQNKLTATSATLSKYTNEGPKVTFLGIEFDQHVFATLFAVILFGSVIAVLFFALRYKKSNAVMAHSKSLLSELEEEYQNYKQKSIEREQKISRLLQDEINRQKKLNAMNAS